MPLALALAGVCLSPAASFPQDPPPTTAMQTPVKQATVKLDVEVEGLEGDLERNVVLQLDDRRKRNPELTEAEVRDFHEDADREIRKALEPFGYYRPIVTRELTHEGGRWRARYVVDSGPPMRVDSLDVRVLGEGTEDPAFQKVVAELPLHRGDVLVHAVYEQVKTTFTTTAMRNGFLDGHFEEHALRVDLDRYASSVVLHYQTGPRYLFGPVTFQQDVVDTELVSGYVDFKQGAPLDFNRLVELEAALGNSPYFSHVEVRLRRDLARGPELPIVVTLVPSKPQKYTVGAGYGTDNGPHARGLIELRRLNRRGHRGEIDGTFSSVERSGAVKYQIPWPYPRTDVLTFSGGYAMTRTSVAEENTSFLGTNLSRLWAGWSENFALQYRRERFVVGLDQGTSNFLVPAASWSRLRVNDPTDPSDGRRLLFRVQGAHDAVVSAASFLQLDAQGKWLRSFGLAKRLIGRAESGYTWTNDFHALPPAFRFFAGGAQSVRGYDFNTLGRRDVAGNVIGGEAIAVASVEYEHRFLGAWGAAMFWDIGNAVETFRTGLEQGAGVGVRWRSPIGMVRVDFAVPLTEPDHQVHLHLAIGPPL